MDSKPNFNSLVVKSLAKRGITLDYRLYTCARVIEAIYYKHSKEELNDKQIVEQIDEAVRIYNTPKSLSEIF